MRRRPLFAGFLALCALALAACGPDGPTVDADKLAAAKDAAKSMIARFEAADPKGAPPRMSDPAVAAELSVLYANDYLASLETLPIEQGAELGEWAEAGNNVGVLYLLWGTGETFDSLTGDQAVIDQVNRNTAIYRDELGPYFDFALFSTEAIARSTAADIANLSDEERSNPDLEAAIEQVRDGFAQTITGALGLFETPGLTADWLAQRLPALKACSKTAVSFLEPDVWTEIAGMAAYLASAAADPQLKKGLVEFGDS